MEGAWYCNHRWNRPMEIKRNANRNDVLQPKMNIMEFVAPAFLSRCAPNMRIPKAGKIPDQLFEWLVRGIVNARSRNAIR